MARSKGEHVTTYRHNVRNEVVTLRALLKVAIRALRDNECMVPVELQRWLKAQQPIRETEKMKAEITIDMAHEVRNG